MYFARKPALYTKLVVCMGRLIIKKTAKLIVKKLAKLMVIKHDTPAPST